MPIHIPRRNVAPADDAVEVSERELEIINDLGAGDLEVYEYGRRLFHERFSGGR